MGGGDGENWGTIIGLYSFRMSAWQGSLRKVERSHCTDQEEFYQLLTYTDDVDLNKKLAIWENFYNFDRPHGAFKGKTPYEALRNMLG